VKARSYNCYGLVWLSENIYEDLAYEAAQLLSGSFTYLLYRALWADFYDLEAINKHLEYLYDNEDHYGLLYFIAMLADAVSSDIPVIFSQMSANKKLVPVLSSAVIEDWLEYHESVEPIIID
jgi:hypothetical protein